MFLEENTIILFYISESYCKDKWRNLRTGFQRSLKETKIKGKRRHFYLHSEMDFLLPYYENKNQKSINNPDDQDENDDCDFSDEFVGSPNSLMYEDDNTDMSMPTADVIINSVSKDDEIQKNLQEILDSEEVQTYTINRDDYELLKKIKEKQLNSQENENKTKYPRRPMLQEPPLSYDENKDPNLLFFKGILPDIVTLTRKNQRLLKTKIIMTINEMHQQQEDMTDSFLDVHVKSENVTID